LGSNTYTFKINMYSDWQLL